MGIHNLDLKHCPHRLELQVWLELWHLLKGRKIALIQLQSPIYPYTIYHLFINQCFFSVFTLGILDTLLFSGLIYWSIAFGSSFSGDSLISIGYKVFSSFRSSLTFLPIFSFFIVVFRTLEIFSFDFFSFFYFVSFFSFSSFFSFFSFFSIFSSLSSLSFL